MALNYFEGIINMSPVTIATTLIIIFLGILYFVLKDRSLPPGPIGLPVLGYWPFLQHDTIHIQLQELQKKYGDVFSFTVAGKLFIHLGTIKAVKEAHLTKSDCFSRRNTDYSLLTMALDKGIIIANDEEWKSLRKFFVQAFREYGLSSMKEYMTGPIYDSVNAFVDDLKATKGAQIDIVPILSARSSEIFRRMMFNDDEITDEELQGILKAFQDLLSIFVGRNLLLTGNVAKYFVFPRLEGYKEALESRKILEDYLIKIIKKHEKTYNEDNIRDIIDSYIKERRERFKKDDPSAEHFSDAALVSSLIEFIGDGILSVAIFISYFIYALLEHPEEQEKIYKELEDVVGPSRQVTLEDRNKLVHTNAFIQEVLRITDFMTLFPGLECTKETTLGGYRIPKGSITVINMWACHRDPKIFEEPDVFKPSRYITEPGKPKTEASVIFGVGKRSCAGESFTMMQVFLFFTTIIKNFRLECPKAYVKKAFFDKTMEVYAHRRK